MVLIDHDPDIRAEGPAVPFGAQFAQFSTKYEIPEGAIVMSRGQMRELVYRTIVNWEPRSDMWYFRYGNGITAAGAAMSGVYFNSVFRNKFKLRNFGPLMTFGPTCIIPCITTLMVQSLMVTSKLLLNEFDCPSCAQIRSSTLMVGTGFFQPLLLSLFSCSIISSYRYTVKLPSLKDPKAVLAAYTKMLRPMQVPMLGLLLVNVGLGVFMTQQQQKAVIRVHKRLQTGY